ncbi:MAG: UDP-N-acetylmuramoyl-tripeptide--D-alanyl-D-alanine ligase, partial [Oscillospiraceae bacterium]|nr:UDP-N-acetylmuramoyl-tripeptide--D-alanyl-D-alanine ligase [Oscillospiraceae bacterium]
IRGENFNGNDFVAAAAEKGAAAAMCDGDVSADIPVIYTRDSRTAQLVLARYYRGKFPVKLCGVTGSVGKTSTKDMVYAVLSAKYNTLKTEGNFNNDIGMPRTLFRLNEGFGAAVIEMGMSDLGEISQLSRVAHPDAAIITNIGYCHIENLKSRENILRAKLEILDGAAEGAPLIINGDDEYLGTISGESLGRRVIRYGFGADCDVMAVNIVHTPDGERFELVAEGKRYAAELKVVGEHHIMNALAAFCAGREFGMTAEEIIPAFLNYEASGMRQRIERRGDITVILDCYNASPTSMRSALSVLGSIEAQRKIAVLGDMLELGEMSRQLHAIIADYIRLHADACFLYGREMAVCRDALTGSGVEVFHSEDKGKLTEQLNEYLSEGDAVLFKGSRGMKMEEIAEKVHIP